MNIKRALAAASAAVILFSCAAGSADKKVPELANEMCDCFSGFQKDLSPDVMALLKKVSISATPRQAMQEGLAKLKPEEAGPFIEKFSQISNKTSEVNKCMQEFDRKHAKETTKDKKAFTQKLLKEMQANDKCPAGAALVNIGLQQQVVKF